MTRLRDLVGCLVCIALVTAAFFATDGSEARSKSMGSTGNGPDFVAGEGTMTRLRDLVGCLVCIALVTAAFFATDGRTA